jgi:UDP-N-acetylmuramate dehydrogenase
MTKNPPSIPRLFREAVGRALRRRVSLQRHSSFRIGGPADYFFSAASFEELRACLLFARERALHYYIMGAGSNILFSDGGFRGLILKNEVKGIRPISKDGRAAVFSGTPLSDLVEFALEDGLEGLEFAAGIPGTVGGAVFGNAGAFGRCIGELLTEAVLLDARGEEFKVNGPYFEFSYRHSALKSRHAIIVTAVLKLNRGDRGAIKARIEENLEKRRSRHPSTKLAYAGSYFKNPVGPDGKKIAAGYLLEKVGAKGLEMGGAAVFSGHANFILNRGGARAEDVLRLSQELKERVKREFGIDLEEEVIYLPEDFSMP